jgi:SSS family solute:Na+ symporter
VWALWQSLSTTSVLDKSVYAYTIYSAALTPVILAAFFWKRATAKGAVASIAAGTIITVCWSYMTPHLPPAVAVQDAIVPALVASLICLIAVSLATEKPSEAQLAPFAG